MIGKSFANDFQYTKLKDKHYLYFSLNIPCFLTFFFLIQFIYQSLFFVCLLKLVISLNLIHFYLMYYQDNSAEHHKLSILHSVEIARFFRKKTGNKINKNVASP